MQAAVFQRGSVAECEGYDFDGLQQLLSGNRYSYFAAGRGDKLLRVDQDGASRAFDVIDFQRYYVFQDSIYLYN